MKSMRNEVTETRAGTSNPIRPGSSTSLASQSSHYSDQLDDIDDCIRAVPEEYLDRVTSQKTSPASYDAGTATSSPSKRAATPETPVKKSPGSNIFAPLHSLKRKAAEGSPRKFKAARTGPAAPPPSIAPSAPGVAAPLKQSYAGKSRMTESTPSTETAFSPSSSRTASALSPSRIPRLKVAASRIRADPPADIPPCDLLSHDLADVAATAHSSASSIVRARASRVDDEPISHDLHTVLPASDNISMRSMPESRSNLSTSSTTASFSRASASEISGTTVSTLTSSNVTVAASQPSPSVDPEEALCQTPVILVYSHYRRGLIGSLPYGAQWELARYVGVGIKFDDIPIHSLTALRALRTNAKAAPEVTKTISNLLTSRPQNDEDDAFVAAFAQERNAKLPWDELDREEENLAKDPHSGLGCNPDSSWYGGRVHFTAKVAFDNSGPTTLKLDRPTLGSSNQLARRFGSWRFIRVRIPKDLPYRGDKKAGEGILVLFFKRPFVLNGRVFRAFYAKEHNVFLVQTNETWDGTQIVEQVPSSMPSLMKMPISVNFLEFINNHNNMDRNRHQTMVKWAARFALGLSNSIPGVQLEPANIAFEDDQICDTWDGQGTPPNEQIMTDGCGLIRYDILQAITERLTWTAIPTAVQMRVFGSKGLLLSHPDSLHIKEESPCIWLRPSQIKIRHAHNGVVPPDLDPIHLTVDILRASRLSSPARLSTETIINLADNSVPTEAFMELLNTSIRQKVEALTNWEGDNAMFQLWVNVARSGSIVSQRLAREAAGAARAKGYVFEDFADRHDEDGLEELDEALGDCSTAWWDDTISGCPSTLEETVMVLLDSGLHPKTCPVLGEKLKQVIKKEIHTFINRYRIEVPMSCTAYIVPDPLGVLEPGEIHLKSSRRNLLDQEGRLTDIVLGDVLVTRHPCKVPTDVQKSSTDQGESNIALVKAVFKEKLHHYVDVIVVSIKNHISNNVLLNRHLASCTGGGDYDGDTMEVFWDPRIVKHFKSADPSFLSEPEEVASCLVKDKKTVSDFLAEHEAPLVTTATLIFKLQDYLLAAIRDVTMVGTYSTWWENSIYKHGYRDPRTVFLAYMFCAILDGSKSGVSVPTKIYEAHKRTIDMRVPRWKEKSPSKGARIERNIRSLPRDKELGPFIMDEIQLQVQKECDKQLRFVEQLFVEKTVELDAHLAGPWREAEARSRQAGRSNVALRIKQELDAIKAHVQQVYTVWKNSLQTSEDARGGGGSASSGKGKAKAGFTGLSIETRQDTLRRISRLFHSGPTGVMNDGVEDEADELLIFDEISLRRIRASYAYIYDYERSSRKWSRFPWDVDTRTLGEIKAQALGLSKTVTRDFYFRMTIGKAWVRDS